MDNNVKETTEASKGNTSQAEGKDNGQYMDTIKSALTSTKQAATEALGTVKTKAMDWQEYMSNYIQDNPWKSVGIAALSGWLIAKLFNRNK